MLRSMLRFDDAMHWHFCDSRQLNAAIGPERSLGFGLTSSVACNVASN